MHIKRFEAATLAEALAEVKSVLGPDALILSSRTIRRSRDRFGLLSRSVVEVQAARERDANPGVAAPVEADRVVEPEAPPVTARAVAIPLAVRRRYVARAGLGRCGATV